MILNLSKSEVFALFFFDSIFFAQAVLFHASNTVCSYRTHRKEMSVRHVF
jgi:hypothetical protein